jgi:hypothetical protein
MSGRRKITGGRGGAGNRGSKVARLNKHTGEPVRSSPRIQEELERKYQSHGNNNNNLLYDNNNDNNIVDNHNRDIDDTNNNISNRGSIGLVTQQDLMDFKNDLIHTVRDMVLELGQQLHGRGHGHTQPQDHSLAHHIQPAASNITGIYDNTNNTNNTNNYNNSRSAVHTNVVGGVNDGNSNNINTITAINNNRVPTLNNNNGNNGDNNLNDINSNKGIMIVKEDSRDERDKLELSISRDVYVELDKFIPDHMKQNNKDTIKNFEVWCVCFGLYQKMVTKYFIGRNPHMNTYRDMISEFVCKFSFDSVYQLDKAHRKSIAQSTPQELIDVISPIFMATHLINNNKYGGGNIQAQSNSHDNYNNNNNNYKNNKRKRESPSDGICDAYQKGLCQRGTSCKYKHINREYQSAGASTGKTNTSVTFNGKNLKGKE